MREDLFIFFGVLGISPFLPGGYTHSPVFKFLAVDAHSSLVALGDTHLVSAALNLLTRVLGGVYIWGGKENETCNLASTLLHFSPPFHLLLSLCPLLSITRDSVSIIRAAQNCWSCTILNMHRGALLFTGRKNVILEHKITRITFFLCLLACSCARFDRNKLLYLSVSDVQRKSNCLADFFYLLL